MQTQIEFDQLTIDAAVSTVNTLMPWTNEDF